MTPAIRLADPPREIPPGLQLRLLASRDVTASLIYFIPAAATLVILVHSFESAGRIALIAANVFFLWLGLRAALPALARAMRTLGRMRYGFPTLGRIVTCRLAWDGKRADRPYAEFLPEWATNVAKSQVGKLFGCLQTIMVAIFIAPLLVMMLVAAAVAVMKFLQQPLGDAMAGEVDLAYLAQWLAMGVVCVAAILIYMHFYRRAMVNSVEPYLEWCRLMQPGKDDVYDENAMRLVELAKERGAQISLKQPLPADHAGIELICRAEYSVQGEPCTGEGRVRLSDRLDIAGVEPLLFNPLQREKIVFMAGLPVQARVDATGQWASVPPAGPAVALALTALVAGAALVGFGFNVSWIIAAIR